MPAMTGKQALAQMLIAEGIEYIFGNPGTSETPLLYALQDFPQLKYIQALQEGTAVGMADGYSQATGCPAFANIHIAGGLRHMLNDRERQSEYVGMDFANPLDLAAIGQALGVSGERVEDPQALASVVRQSFDSGRPAVIDVSIDVSL